MPYAAVTGWGMAVPNRVLTNAELSARLGMSEDAIVSLTGIVERRVVGPGDTAATLATAAGQRALARAGLDVSQLDLIVVATATPGTPLSSISSQVRAAIGSRAGAFDTSAASAGFVTALSTGTQYLRTGGASRALVIGVDVLTPYVDPNDAATSILFGDGAGAVVIEATDAPHGLVSTVLGADGSGHGALQLPIGSPAGRSPNGHVGGPYLKMNGRRVYRFAVPTMGDAAEAAAARAGLALADIDLIIPHQANRRIIESAMRRIDLPLERSWINLDRYGNTTSASVAIALADAADAGRLAEGDTLLLVGFGAGLAWAAGIVRWGAASVTRRRQPPDSQG